MHELRIDTRERVLTLDGVNIADCAEECTVRYRGTETPVVTLKLLANVKLQDLVSVEEKRLDECGK